MNVMRVFVKVVEGDVELFFDQVVLNDEVRILVIGWFEIWQVCFFEELDGVVVRICVINFVYIFCNEKVEEVLEVVMQGDFGFFDCFFECMMLFFECVEGFEDFIELVLFESLFY